MRSVFAVVLQDWAIWYRCSAVSQTEAFLLGLGDPIKDLMAVYEQPTSIDGAITLELQVQTVAPEPVPATVSIPEPALPPTTGSGSSAEACTGFEDSAKAHVRSEDSAKAHAGPDHSADDHTGPDCSTNDHIGSTRSNQTSDP